MIPSFITFLYLENHRALVEGHAGGATPTWSYALLGDSLEDPSRDVVWDDVSMHELAYAAYERFEIDADDIQGPEHWAEGYYLRYPQSFFDIADSGADARWIAILCTGDSETVLVSLEKLGTLWNAETSGSPLRHTFKHRTRHAVP